MKRRTVLSLEQALSLPYATLRFAQLGWRVIRIEATGGEGLRGDPNRYIGTRVADDDRRSYFIAPNVGKEAIAINLKDPRGHELRGAPDPRTRRRRLLLQHRALALRARSASTRRRCARRAPT